MTGQTNIYETWFVYHGTWDNFNGLIHKSLPSVIPVLQPIKFLRQNLNITWTPLAVFIELGTYIMPHEAISTAYLIYP
jgi:hypothetical protein